MRFNKLKKEYRTISQKVKKEVREDLSFQIGLEIENLRIIKGITQKQLAGMIGTKQPSIARVESGETLPSLSFIKKIADALNTDISLKFDLNENLSTDTESYDGSIETPYFFASEKTKTIYKNKSKTLNKLKTLNFKHEI